MSRSQEIDRMQNGGAKAAYVYRMAGVPFRGTVEATEFVPDRRIAFAMKGDIEGTIRLDFEEAEGGTLVTYAADYDLAGLHLLRAARPLARANNERVLRRTLANLACHFGN